MSTINQLIYFNRVVELGSISLASQQLDVQPSSISRQLAALEQFLGVRLLHRTTRNVGPTEAGVKYYHYSRRIIADLDEAKRSVSALQQMPSGTLRLSATVGFGESVILPLLTEFERCYPDVTVDIELTERVVDLIDENVDLAIRSGRLVDSNLISKKLMDNDFIVCASAEFLARHGKPQDVAELVDFRCIKYSYRGWRDWYVINDKPTKLNVGQGISINSVNGQRQLLLNDYGLALIPSWAVQAELQNGSVTRILEDYCFSPYEQLSATYAIYLNRELLAPKVRAFLDFINSKLKNEHGS